MQTSKNFRLWITNRRRICIAASLVCSLAACSSTSESGPEPKNLIADPTLSEADLLLSAKDTYDQGLFSVSQKSWADLRDGYPASYYLQLAELKSADAFFFSGDFGSAIVGYQEFVRLHPGHEAVPYARFQVARAHFEQYRGKEHDQSPLLAAIKSFTEVIDRHPGSGFAEQAKTDLKRCQDLHAEHIAQVARFYDKMGLYEAAENRVAALEEKFPSSVAAQELSLTVTENYVAETDQSENGESESEEADSENMDIDTAESEPETDADLDEQGPTLLSNLTCTPTKNGSIITLRSTAPLDAVSFQPQEGKQLTITASELVSANTEPRTSVVGASNRVLGCSDGRVTATAVEETTGKKRTIKVALVSSDLMQFSLRIAKEQLHITAVTTTQ